MFLHLQPTGEGLERHTPVNERHREGKRTSQIQISRKLPETSAVLKVSQSEGGLHHHYRRSLEDSSQSRSIWRKETWPRIHWSFWLSSKDFQNVIHHQRTLKVEAVFDAQGLNITQHVIRINTRQTVYFRANRSCHPGAAVFISRFAAWQANAIRNMV